MTLRWSLQPVSEQLLFAFPTVKTSQPAGTWQLISDQHIWRQSVLIRAIMCVQAAGMNTHWTHITHTQTHTQTHTHTIHTGSALSLLQGHPHCSIHACAVCVVSAEAVKQRQYYVNSALMDSTKSCQVWETVGVCVCVCVCVRVCVFICAYLCVRVCVDSGVWQNTLSFKVYRNLRKAAFFFLLNESNQQPTQPNLCVHVCVCACVCVCVCACVLWQRLTQSAEAAQKTEWVESL